ncbi:hypothetical protein R1T43_10080 [Alteromonas sp. CI.11.F.A3]|uniref:hypothetical protein n=1 Tax=Alteromonas sp. CI.11.F.A3 TaxID=3079555 RepID=UPI0029424790|nr:hypothetical protein [Alteromonas sp. CI.11.F.A3]WOI35583.1 hypothetical protein R1T43_10080 [Alteromonas sp. CI.11.F.A3]
MEEVIVGEVAKGLFRAVGYLIIELFFWTVCYWVGWPICKAVTLGAYPKQVNLRHSDIEDGNFGALNIARIIARNNNQHSGAWCALVGLAVVISAFFFVITHF